MYLFVRLILCLILYVFLIKNYNKKIIKILILTCVIVLFSVSFFLPFENLLVSFSNPKELNMYLLKEEPIDIICGKKSDMFVEKDRNLISVSIATKNEKGYKIPLSIDIKKETYHYRDYIVEIITHKKTKDTYIHLRSNKAFVSIEDNLLSIFHRHQIENSQYDYYAFLENYSIGYQLYLDNTLLNWEQSYNFDN